MLVGINTADDAGVFLLEPGIALVQTVDMLTPMVEDPYTFGRIAATNSLSDVYAMGGKPVTVLNIIGFPGPMDKQLLAEMLRGGQDTVITAGAVVCGGHTFNEKEIKYGLSVTGRVAPERVVTNAGAQPGHVLVLTKPLGTGLFAQAMLTQEEVDPTLYKAATESMTQLNRIAGEAMARHNVSAGTDITGYGLLGHAQEMAEGSKVRLALYAGALPLLPGVIELVRAGVEEPGMLMNETSFGSRVEWQPGVDEGRRKLLWESESSGGLLVALPTAKVESYRKVLADGGVMAAVVGEVLPGPAGTIEVRA